MDETVHRRSYNEWLIFVEKLFHKNSFMEELIFFMEEFLNKSKLLIIPKDGYDPNCPLQSKTWTGDEPDPWKRKE